MPISSLILHWLDADISTVVIPVRIFMLVLASLLCGSAGMMLLLVAARG